MAAASERELKRGTYECFILAVSVLSTHQPRPRVHPATARDP